MNLVAGDRGKSMLMPGWRGRLRWSGSLRANRNATEHGIRRHSGDAGATLVEFALSVSILLMMLFGLTAMCLAFYTYSFVADAAREATRYAIVRGSTCTDLPDCNATTNQISNYVKQLGFPGMNTSNMTITTSWLTASSTLPTSWSSCATGTCNAPGNGVRVVVTYAVPLTIPFVSPNALNVSSTSQMVISQ